MKTTDKRVWAAGIVVVLLSGGLFITRHLRERDSIPSQGGQSLSVSAIPTPHYLQRDPQWAQETIGGSDEMVARVGCTVCSLAMALHHYGVQMDPKRLNDYLKTHAGYTSRGWLRWESVSQLSQGKVILDYLGKASFRRIDRALMNSQPVIAKVLVNQNVPHWVLIVGKDNTEYIIRDPLGDGKNLRPLSGYGSGVYGIRILKASP